MRQPIIVGKKTYEHDIVIGLDGRARKRKKKLSKKVHGTCHVFARRGLERILEKGAEVLLVGTGQHGVLGLGEDAARLLEERGVRASLAPTPQALEKWNLMPPGTRAVGLFHVTC